MIQCPYCGYPNKENNSYCVMCKEVLTPTTPRKVRFEDSEEESFNGMGEIKKSWILDLRSPLLYVLLVTFIIALIYYIFEVHPTLTKIIRTTISYPTKMGKIPLKPTKEEEMEGKLSEYAHTVGDYSDVIAYKSSQTEDLKEEESFYKEVEYFVSGDYIYYTIGDHTYYKEMTEEERKYVDVGEVEPVVQKEEPKIYIVDKPAPKPLPRRRNIVHSTVGTTWYLPAKTKSNYNLKRNLPKLFDLRRPRIDKKMIHLYSSRPEGLTSKQLPKIGLPNLKRSTLDLEVDVHKEKLVIDKLNKDTVGQERLPREKLSY